MNAETSFSNRFTEAIEYAKRKTPNVYNWNDTLKKYTVVAFGLGKFFQDTHSRLFEMCEIAYVSDNNEKYWDQYFYGKKCIRPEEIQKLENPFVIAVVGNYIPIREQMRNLGISVMHISEMHFSNYLKGESTTWLECALPDIKEALELLADDQSRNIFADIFCNKIYGSDSDVDYESFATGGEYFQNGFWALGENEYFIDGGAYIGDTVADFIKNTNGNFGAVYSFEYELSNYELLCKNLKGYPEDIKEKIETFHFGIWNKKETGWCEHFGESDGTQIITADSKSLNSEECRLNKLDDMLAGKKVTVLKLDIEGAEVQGLLGARNIIATQKPKLAICLYHRPEDLWEIPLLIHKLHPDYKMVIRHHSYTNYTDTVLYAQ